MNTIPPSEDRIWAVLSHLSALTLGIGILLPIVGWSDQRRKSNYGAFQNLQALGYQSLGFTIWLLAFLGIIIPSFVILVAVFENLNTVPRSWLIFISIVLFGFFVLYLLLPIIGAIACALGKDFRYPILGERLARYTQLLLEISIYPNDCLSSRRNDYTFCRSNTFQFRPWCSLSNTRVESFCRFQPSNGNSRISDFYCIDVNCDDHPFDRATISYFGSMGRVPCT